MAISGVTSAFQAGSSNSSTNTGKSNSSEGVREFMAYASETPAKRMFDSWLGSQHMTMDQFNNLPADKQAALVEQYREEMEKRMGSSGQGDLQAENGTFVSATA